MPSLSGYWRRCLFSLRIDISFVRLHRLGCNRVESTALPHQKFAIKKKSFSDLPSISSIVYRKAFVTTRTRIQCVYGLLIDLGDEFM